MRIELTKQECKWLVDITNKAKIEAGFEFEETQHPLWELHHDNLAALENKLNAAIQKQIQKERRDRDER